MDSSPTDVPGAAEVRTAASDDPVATAASLVATFGVASGAQSPALVADVPLKRIAFLSCIGQEKPAPALRGLLRRQPDLSIFMGDNVYGDIRGDEVAALAKAYGAQAQQADVNALRAAAPVLAVWDDHDYGRNDAGAEFEHKTLARELFAAFWHLDPRELPDGEGVYRSVTVGPAGRRTQIILLDTRSFRSPLKPTDQRGAPGRERYLPDEDTDKTLLGEAQWQWLRRVLQEPAELRLLVSSIQVIADGHGYEAWRLLPAERERLYAMLRELEPEGLILLSGDRHIAGMYRRDIGLEWPLFEATSSSVNLSFRSEDDPQEAGPHRIGDVYGPVNTGLLNIDWEAGRVTVQILDEQGAAVRTQSMVFSATP